MNRGKLTIFIILSVAVVAALFAWSYRLRRATPVLGVWGSRAVVAVRLAPKVELLKLQPLTAAGQESPDILVSGKPLRILDRRDISQAKGLIHARHALLQKESFTWGEADNQPAEWSYAFQFSADGEPTTVMLDFGRRRLTFLDSGRVAGMEAIAEALEVFVNEQFEGTPGSGT